MRPGLIRAAWRRGIAVATLLGGLLLAAAPSSAAPPKQVPLKETLTLIGSGPGVAYYVGTATHLGQVRVVETFNPDFDPTDPDSVFATYIKTAASGDVVFGVIIPDDPANPFTTGAITIEGGTGRLRGATGVSRYVVSADPVTGVSVRIEGTMTSVGSNK